MSAAMPTIISELGGLHLYAWTYTAYFLSRAVSLPVFGKLSDLYSTKGLFLFSIGLFLVASIAAGASPSMGFLVAARVFQGIGGGGIFALVYVVLSDISTPADRAKTLSLASLIWGVASLVGPTLGGFIVTWCSWRWVFFINIPLGIPSIIGITLFFKELRKKPAQSHIDFAGVALLSGFILGFLTLIMVGGRELNWISSPMIIIGVVTCACGAGFYLAEKHAKDPILDFKFFRSPTFALGNSLVFCASFSIFALFAYAPLFLQGTLSQTPLQVGYAMLSLSLGWSLGSIVAGRKMHRIGQKRATFIGVILMLIGTGLTLGFSRTTTIYPLFPHVPDRWVGYGIYNAVHTAHCPEQCENQRSGGGNLFSSICPDHGRNNRGWFVRRHCNDTAHQPAKDCRSSAPGALDCPIAGKYGNPFSKRIPGAGP